MTNLRETMARALYEHREKPVVNADFSRQQALWHDCLLQADAAMAAIEAAGFAVVPREPTENMVEAGMAARNKMAGRVSGVIGQTTDSSWRHEFWHELAIYAAMLDAAPKP